MVLHSIRLGEPWERERIGAADCELLRSTRRFGRPYALPANERLTLVLEGFGHAPRVELNGQVVPLVALPDGRLAVDVTEALAARNRLVIDSPPNLSGGCALLQVSGPGD